MGPRWTCGDWPKEFLQYLTCCRFPLQIPNPISRFLGYPGASAPITELIYSMDYCVLWQSPIVFFASCCFNGGLTVSHGMDFYVLTFFLYHNLGACGYDYYLGRVWVQVSASSCFCSHNKEDPLQLCSRFYIASSLTTLKTFLKSNIACSQCNFP